MPNYFQGWKRKLGVLTLAMACVLAIGWVRSLYICDALILRNNDATSVFFVSNRSWLFWQTAIAEGATQKQKLKLPTSYQRTKAQNINRFFKCYPGQPGGTFVLDKKKPSPFPSLTVRAIPYWSIVLPLTLISGWLLLSKPRGERATA